MPLIASRLRQRRQTVTLTVKAKTLAAGQHTEATVSGLSAVVATRDPKSGDEIFSDTGDIVVVSDVFWFEPLNGSLPAITSSHVLVDSDGVRYEVVATPQDQAGGGNRLKVMTRRVQ